MTTVPTPVAGKFLWTRIQIQFNTGSPITAYSVSRYGIDGTGAVSSVNSVSPDSNGNVALLASDIPASDSISIQSHISDIESDVSDLTTAITNEIITVSSAFAIPASGSSVTKNVSGITADHVLILWNFSTSAENSPPCNLSWSTASGSFTISNTGGTTSESITPVFELPTAKTAT